MFLVGEKVLAKNFRSSRPKWIVGEVVEVSGPLSYVIKLNNVMEIRRPDSQIDSEMYGGDFNSSSQTAEPFAVSPTDQPCTGGIAQMSKTITPATSITNLLHIDHFMKEDCHNVMDGLFYTKGGGM